MNLLAVSSVKQKVVGFTLIEVMLVVALILIIGAIVSPVGIAFYRAQLLNEASDGLVSALRQAQNFSLSGKDNSSFGIYVQENEYIFFAGDTYASRNVDEDEVYPVSSAVSVSGPNEMVFSKLTGTPSEMATYIITVGTKEKQIEILESGNINR